VPSIQTAQEIRDILRRLEHDSIRAVQVLGINSLKSISPLPEDLIGARVTRTAVDDRILTIDADAFRISVDLQRTGRLVWLPSADAYRAIAGDSRPTLRLLLASGAGLDLTEPAKTKRITVTLSTA